MTDGDARQHYVEAYKHADVETNGTSWLGMLHLSGLASSHRLQTFEAGTSGIAEPKSLQAIGAVGT